MAELISALGGGEITRFVGGAVRDTLLDLPVSDVDLATRLEPGEVVERLRAAGIKAVPTGIAHGTVTAVSAGKPVEVTTLRRDVSTDGRRATGRIHRQLARGCGPARFHHQRALRRARNRRRSRLFRRPGGPRCPAGPVHRRSAHPDCRRPSPHPAFLPLSRTLRARRTRSARARRVHGARQRLDGPVA
jgi:hypothetical protein